MLPDFGLAAAIQASAPDAARVTYRDGTPLGYLGPSLRHGVQLAQVDRKVVDLLVAAEDRRFWKHAGVDPRAIVRALLADARAMRPVQGGSTLTQQLLKNTLLRDCPSVLRKILELPLAPYATALLGKASILEHYLNTVYFGSGLYGVGLASRAFLGKPVDRLSWSEAALLAGLPAAPENFAFCRPNPWARPRRDFVLRRGWAAGVLTDAELSSALGEQLPPVRVVHAATRDLLRGGINAPFGTKVLRTTLDRTVHLAASRVARRAANDSWCSIVSIDVSNSEVRALATRWGAADVGYDVGMRGSMSPGSALKPFVLAAALDAGYRVETVFPSGTVELLVDGRTWRVENWMGQSYGRSTLAQATLNSDNTVYARLIAEMGHQRAARVLTSAGLPATPSPGPALALGVLNCGVSPLDLAASYVTLLGLDFRPAKLAADTPSASIVPQTASVASRAVVRKVLVDLVRTQVSGDLARAGAFGKTGTPDDGRTGWFVGVHDGLATAVVLSTQNGAAPTKAQIAARVWAAFYEELRRVRSTRE